MQPHATMRTMMRNLPLMIYAVLLLALHPIAHAQQQSLTELGLGVIEMRMRSTAAIADNLAILLQEIMSETVDYLDDVFYNDFDATFRKVSCTIVTYETGSVSLMADDPESGVEYTATVVMTGRAKFNNLTATTQTDVNALIQATFVDPEAFLRELQINARRTSFITNLVSLHVKTEGATAWETVSEGDSYPPPQPASIDTIVKQEQNNSTTLEVWKIAVIAGGAAFAIVFLLSIVCICCIKLEEEDPTRSTKSSKKLTVKTFNSGRGAHQDSSDIESKSPSPVRSITSQESSIFTYNPKSTRSIPGDSRLSYYTSHSVGGGPNSYFTTNTAMEMDLAAWQSKTQLNPNNTNQFGGNDLSVIEALSNMNGTKKDLSLIQEEVANSSAMDTSSAQSTPSRAAFPKATISSHGEGLTESALFDLAHHDRECQVWDEESAMFLPNNVPTSRTQDSPINNVMDDLQELSHQFDIFRNPSAQRQNNKL